MRRSSRSIPTGPGSRGGHWHEPERRAAYFRAWRAAHPEYRERERERKQRRRESLARLTPTCSAAALRIVSEEVERNGLRPTARRLAYDHASLIRWLRGEREPLAGVIDVIVATYSWDRLLRTKAQMRRAA